MLLAFFTRGARGSETEELRQARVLADIRRANEVWYSGNAPGVGCGINFVSLIVFHRTDYTIAANTLQT